MGSKGSSAENQGSSPPLGRFRQRGAFLRMIGAQEGIEVARTGLSEAGRKPSA